MTNFTSEIFENFLRNQNDDKIIDFMEIDKLIFDKMHGIDGIVLSDSWDYAFRES